MCMSLTGISGQVTKWILPGDKSPWIDPATPSSKSQKKKLARVRFEPAGCSEWNNRIIYKANKYVTKMADPAVMQNKCQEKKDVHITVHSSPANKHEISKNRSNYFWRKQAGFLWYDKKMAEVIIY